MNPVDTCELEILEHTSDIATAELAGQIARDAIEALAVVMAQLLGLPAELLAAELWTHLDGGER